MANAILELQKNSYLRLPQIIGNPKADPPIPPVYPVSKSTWWAGVRSGRFPKSYKLGPRTTAWRVSDILELIERTNREAVTDEYDSGESRGNENGQ
jgi:prophage regulatory protein